MSGNRNSLRASGGGTGGEQRDDDDPARDQQQDTAMDREGQLPPSERGFDPRRDTRTGRPAARSDPPARGSGRPAARSEAPPEGQVYCIQNARMMTHCIQSRCALE